jgi:hypothetical protein
VNARAARDECGRWGGRSGVEGQGMARLGVEVEGRLWSVSREDD